MGVTWVPDVLVTPVPSLGRTASASLLRARAPASWPPLAVDASSVLSRVPVELVESGFVVAAVVVSLLAVRRFAGARWGDALRRRFLLGVPWGTVLTVLFVLSVYWVVQDGWANPNDPLTIPFRSWSYFYPVGVLTAPFSHSGKGHLVGNMLGTVVYAPLVEYVWGHYPRERGSQSFTSPGTNPYARVLAVPAAAVGVGLLTSLFSLGPVIGFSGVVFALAAFAFVTRPLYAVGALVGGRVVRLVWRTVRNPRLTAEPHPGFITPWWANVAIQGHALGLLLGAVLGLLYLRRREERPDPTYLFFAGLVFAISQSLWAFYVPLSGNRFLLLRAIGVGCVFLLAALIVAAVHASDRTLVSRIDLRYREAAVGAVLVLLLSTSLAAVPYNVATVSGGVPDENGDAVTVRGYTVAYAEDVPNRYVSAVQAPFIEDATTINTSGVIVVNERRNMWFREVSKGRLAFAGRVSVTVGGLGWHRDVYASRDTWSVVGNGSTYKVFLRVAGRDGTLAYEAPPVRTEPRIAGRNLTVATADTGFQVVVRRGETVLGRARIPTAGNETRVGGLTINRTGRKLFAIRNGTRVRIAQKRVPPARRDR